MSNNIDPDIYISGLLSEMVYNGTSRYLGWHGVYGKKAVSEEHLEQMRQRLYAGKVLDEQQIQALHGAFYRDDLQRIVNEEICSGAIDQKKRDEMARALFVSLFTKQDHPRGLDEALHTYNKTNPYSGKDADNDRGRLTRDGFYRSKDVHAMSFTKMWDPQEGFDAKKSKVFVVYRGTENDSNPLQSPVVTFLRDYVAKSYRNFSKAFGINYLDPTMAYIDSKVRAGEKIGELVYCGHSLGGAMATEGLLQTGELVRNVGGNVKAHTFGSPGTGRVGPLTLATGMTILLGSLALSSSMILAKKLAQTYLGASFERSAARVGTGVFEQSVHSQARQGLGRVFAALINGTPLALIEQTFQSALNVIDYCGTKARGLLKWGSVDLKNKNMVQDVKSGEIKVTHMADVHDLIGKVGEAFGFDPLGRRISVNSAQKLSLNPLQNHNMTEYVTSMEDVLIRQPDPESRVYLMTMAACRKAVDQMVSVQLKNHLQAQKEGRLDAFLQEQLVLGTDDLHEMPKALNKAVGRASEAHLERFEALSQGKVGGLVKDSKYRWGGVSEHLKGLGDGVMGALQGVKNVAIEGAVEVVGIVGGLVGPPSGIDVRYAYQASKMTALKFLTPDSQDILNRDVQNASMVRLQESVISGPRVPSIQEDRWFTMNNEEVVKKVLMENQGVSRWSDMCINGQKIPTELVRIVAGAASAKEAEEAAWRLSVSNRQHPTITMYGTGELTEEQAQRAQQEVLRRQKWKEKEDQTAQEIERRRLNSISLLDRTSKEDRVVSAGLGHGVSLVGQGILKREASAVAQADRQGVDFGTDLTSVVRLVQTVETGIVQNSIKGNGPLTEPALPSEIIALPKANLTDGEAIQIGDVPRLNHFRNQRDSAHAMVSGVLLGQVEEPLPQLARGPK